MVEPLCPFQQCINIYHPHWITIHRRACYKVKLGSTKATHTQLKCELNVHNSIKYYTQKLYMRIFLARKFPDLQYIIQYTRYKVL